MPRLISIILCWLLTAPAWAQDIGPTHPVFMAGKRGLQRNGLLGAWNLGTVNLLKWSEAIDNSVWSKALGSITSTTIADPSGITTAEEFTGSGVNGYLTQSLGAAFNGIPLTCSCWLKTTTPFSTQISIYNGSTEPLTTATLTTSWQFFSVSSTGGALADFYIGGATTISSGKVVHIALTQCNEGPTALPYVATTDGQRVPTGISGSIPMRREIGGQVVYDPAPDAASKFTYANGETRAVVGTNLLTYSEDGTNAAWIKTLTTIGSPTTAPDGTATAMNVRETIDNNYHQFQQNITFTAGPKVLQFYLKGNQRDYAHILLFDGSTYFFAVYKLSDGTVSSKHASVTATITAATGGYYLCSFEVTTAAGSGGVYFSPSATGDDSGSFAGDTAKGLYVWHPQLNPGTLPDVYQKTEAVSLEPGYYWATLGTTTGAESADPTRRWLGLTFDGSDDRLLSLPTKGSAWTVVNCSEAHCYGVDSASGSFVDGAAAGGASEFALTTGGSYTGTLTWLGYYDRVLSPKDHRQLYVTHIKPTVNARGGTLP